jgi:biotin operon repressor
LALHNKKIKARRNQVASLLSKSFSETEIAQQLGVDQSTISRDIKVLKESAQQFVYDLAKSDLAYYYKQSIDGIEEAKKESWKIYNDQTVPIQYGYCHQSLEPTHKQVQDMVLPMPPNRHHHHNSVLVLAVVLVRLDDTNHGLIDHKPRSVIETC